MPSIALVTQAAPGNSSATATLDIEFAGIGAGVTTTTVPLQVQALPRLFFYVVSTAGGPYTLEPEFALRGNTNAQGLPAPDFLPLDSPVIYNGTGPILLDYEIPAVYIRLKVTTAPAAPASTFRIVLAASV